MDEWSKAPPHSPHEEMAAEEVRVWISAEYIRFFDHFWRCVYNAIVVLAITYFYSNSKG